jgi:ATP synthase protein I
MSATNTRRARRGWTQLTWNERAATQHDGGNREGAPEDALLESGTGWTIVSYLIAGLLAYGGIGWLIGRAVHLSILFPIGMLVGIVISLAWIIYRYGMKGGGQ